MASVNPSYLYNDLLCTFFDGVLLWNRVAAFRVSYKLCIPCNSLNVWFELFLMSHKAVSFYTPNQFGLYFITHEYIRH